MDLQRHRVEDTYSFINQYVFGCVKTHDTVVLLSEMQIAPTMALYIHVSAKTVFLLLLILELFY